MPRIPEEEIDQIRKEADIVSVIGKYLKVEKSGKDYKAVCPFHNDHSPSLTISPRLQIYKCFSCGAGGNVFTFVQNYENISFIEAVEKVAEIVHHPLSVTVDSSKPVVDPRKKALYDVLGETIRYTCYQMSTKDGEDARLYLESRGIDEEVRKKFEIGWNPGNDALTKFLQAKGYDERDMVLANVSKTGYEGLRDVYGMRITFPIHDAKGNPIGFSARTMDPENPSKYVNTTETEVFKKSDLVYNAHRASSLARRAGKLYVCEGVTDVIAFDRAGIGNAVCTLGTSCTEHQIGILKSMAVRVVFCYDGDEAGQAATWRACKMAQAQGCDIGVLLNTTGKDPDELIRSLGKEGILSLVKKEVSWPEFVIHYLKSRTDFENFESRKQFADRAMAEIQTIEDDTSRQYFIDQVASISGLHIKDEKPVSSSNVRYTERRVDRDVQRGSVACEEQILAMMLKSKKAAHSYQENLGFLRDENRDNIAINILETYKQKDTVDPTALLDELDNQEQKNLVVKLLSSPFYEADYNEEALLGAIRKVKISIKEDQLQMFKEQLSKPMNDDMVLTISKEYSECAKDLRRYIHEESKKTS